MYWVNVFTIYLALCIYTVVSVSLNGKWKGHIVSTDIEFAAEIPGGVYSDLEKAGLIEENLIGFNDVKNRWVGNKSIAYTKNFEVNSTFFEAPYVILIFYGLDTFATIYINNEKVGKTSNMFLKYNLDIKKQIKLGNNEIKIIFESSVKVAKKLYDVQSLHYVVLPKCVPKEYNGECHVNHIRKMQASYGWDWGPAFPSMGIWKSVELQPLQNVLVSEITADVYKKNNLWEIDVTVFFETFGPKNTIINKFTNITCELPQLSLNNSLITNLKVKNNLVNATVILYVPNDKVEKWWPNGYGEQKLYLLNVKIKTDSDVVEKKIKVGFRTVELVQDLLEKGRTFYFKINDVPIFAKGSNWIPSSVFPENLSRKATLQNLLKSSKDAHMNMLRVWGGGIYESDLFYHLADEYGIMIWQDFMFACSMYPSTNEFLDNVEKEVIQNMRRLKYHPSIVLWAGNNENEAALYGNWYGTGSAQIYKDDYVKLYVNTIKNKAVVLDPINPFVVSSPSNGLYSEEKNYTGSNPYSNFYGDVHYYNYLRDSWDINQYPVTRFASEYGLQSLPSIYTLMQATTNTTDLQVNSSFMEHRQHLPQGYNYMNLLISKNLKIPKSNNKIKELMDYIYLSQVNQAISIKIETESYRQMKSLFNDVGEGMTMGALYWQLNDVWQAPSWSSIDFGGRWKMLHYYVKEFFSPIIVTSRLTKANELLLYVVSDDLRILENLTIEIIIYEWKSAKSIHTSKLTNITIRPNESKLIHQYWLDAFLEEAGCGSLQIAKKNCMLQLILKDVQGYHIAPPNYVYPYPLKNVSLPNDSITIKIQPEAIPSQSQYQLDFQIEVASQKLALFVWLEIGDIHGQFSENGFHLFNGSKTITFRASKSVTVKDITENLIVTSLSRIYDENLRKSDIQTIINKLYKSK